jgi:hypothetical protein
MPEPEMLTLRRASPWIEPILKSDLWPAKKVTKCGSSGGSAVRRMGELLKQFDGRGDHMKKDGTVLSPTQKEAADKAGISERQIKTAVRVANLSQETFDSAVEAERPAKKIG